MVINRQFLKPSKSYKIYFVYQQEIYIVKYVCIPSKITSSSNIKHKWWQICIISKANPAVPWDITFMAPVMWSRMQKQREPLQEIIHQDVITLKAKTLQSYEVSEVGRFFMSTWSAISLTFKVRETFCDICVWNPAIWFKLPAHYQVGSIAINASNVKSTIVAIRFRPSNIMYQSENVQAKGSLELQDQHFQIVFKAPFMDR